MRSWVTCLAQPSGVLRASFPVDFAVTYLAPLIVQFASLYPDIRFDFDLTPRQVDLVSEPFDVAIRIGQPADSQLIARQLASLPAYLYASPAYLEQAGEPDEPAQLAAHACLNMLRAGLWTLQNDTESVQVTVSSRFTLNSAGLIRRLATLGQGIVLMPEAMVADEVAAGRLRRILPRWHGQHLAIYALTETRLLPAKTQRFIEFLRKHFSDVGQQG